MHDAGPLDSGTPDSGLADAGPLDAGPSADAGSLPDAGAIDAGPSTDAGTTDGGPITPDAGSIDAGWIPRVDAGFPVLALAGCRPQLSSFAQPEFDMPEAVQDVVTLRMAPDGTPNLAVTTDRGLYLVRRAPDGGFDVDTAPRVDLPGLQAVVGDWNGDGLPDLAYCAQVDAGLVFAFGTGDGGLDVEVVAHSGSCGLVTLADDRDGRDELAVVEDGDIAVWHVQDDGGAIELASRATSGLHGVGALDVDGDGRADPVYVRDEGDGGMTLVEVTSTTQRIDGERIRPLPPPSIAGSEPSRRGRVIADLNGDGLPDVVIGNDAQHDASYNFGRVRLDVDLQLPDGGFESSALQSDIVGWALPSMAELDGNDAPDLVVTDGWNQQYGFSSIDGILMGSPALGLQLFYGDGQGGFTAGPEEAVGYPETPTGAYLQGAQTMALVRAALHGDDDLISWAFGKSRVHLLVNEGDGRLFIPESMGPQRIRSPYWPDPQTIGGFVEGVTNVNGAGATDFNGDGRVDLSSRLGVFINRGDWLQVLGRPVNVPTAFFNMDIDGDGRDEMVTETQVARLFDDGGAETSLYRVESAPMMMNAQSLLPGRFSNGPLQMVSAERPDGTLKLWDIASDGGVSGPTILAVDAGANWLVSGDFDEDGIPDVAAVGTQVLVFSGGDAGLHEVYLDAATKADSLGFTSVGDFDGDGHLDFAFRSCSHSASCGLILYFGSGDGGFTPIAQDAPGGLLAADVDGDGRAELLDENNGIWSWQGAAVGLVLQRVLLGEGSNVIVPKAADFDGDGRVDVISHGWLVRNTCRDIGR